MTEPNRCPNRSCNRTKPYYQAFCASCWFRLPAGVQRKVWSSYRDSDPYDHLDFLVRLGARLASNFGPWPEP